MRKLGATGDSLELLLDTVCSMFGAILLIAILVALQAQTSTVPSAGDQAGTEILNRRIAAAEADLAGVREAAAALGAPADPALAALAAEKQQLEQALAAARARNAQTAAQLKTQVAQQTVDYSAESKTLAADLLATQRQLEEVENAIRTQEENRTRLEGRTRDLSQQTQSEKAAKTVALRFPKERAQTKRQINVICKFGRIYPLKNSNGRLNEETIRWKELDQDSAVSRPIEGRGWALPTDAAKVDGLLRANSAGEVYFALFVFPDSFEIFHALRERATAAGFEFGVSLEPAGEEMVWGSKGYTPPPL